MSIIYILLAILLLGVLVIIHEWGHFAAARATGIAVQEFSVGFGPLLFSRKGKKGTMFSLRAIPLGGYCAFYSGEEEEAVPELSYYRQPVWKRIITTMMGPLMNGLLALLAATLIYWVGGTYEVLGYNILVSEVEAGGPAEAAGMLPGDEIDTVNGVVIRNGYYAALPEAIGTYEEIREPLPVTFYRGEDLLEAQITPFYDQETGSWRIGVMTTAQPQLIHKDLNLLASIRQGWSWCIRAGGMILNTLKTMISTGEGVDQLSGPVGVVSAVSQQVQSYGLEALAELLVMLSINLGIMNLLPIPGLDGSRLIFLAIEWVRGKPIPPEKEAIVHMAGYALLVALLLFCTWQDLARLFIAP